MVGRGWKLVSWVVVLLGAASAHAQTRETRALSWPTPERYVLANGLEVILQDDARTPEVAVMLTYRVGSMDDPEGLEGLAHVVEHMTFRGSRHVPPLQALAWPQEWGASKSDAHTAADVTIFSTVGPPEILERVLWVESDRMAFTLESMTEANLELERAIVERERSLRASAGLGVTDLASTFIYPKGHPRARTVLDEQGLANIQLADVQWMFQRGYRPDNATLTLVGSFDREPTKALIEKYFGSIVAPSVRLQRPPTPALTFGGHATLHVDVRSRTDEVLLAWALPVEVLGSRRAELHLLMPALRKLLDEKLVRTDRVASGVGAHISVIGSSVVLWLDVAASEKSDAAGLSAALERALTSLRSKPLSSASFRALQNGAEWDLLFALEAPGYRAHELGVLRPPDRPEDLFDPAAMLRELRAMTSEGLQQVAAEWLPSDHRLDALVRGL